VTTKITNALRTTVAAVALLALALPASAQEKTDTVTMMQKGVKVVLSGNINKAVLWADDGDTSRTMIVDNNSLSSRLNLTIDAPINPDFAFGAQFEYEFPSNNSTVVTLQGNGDFNQASTTLDERKAEVLLKHKRFGTVWLGQGSQATDEIIEIDLSGTAVAGNYADSSLIGSSILFFNDRTKTTAGSPTVAQAINPLNGTRLDRIRYDTPTIYGFMLSGAFVSGGSSDVALRYGNKFGDFEVAAGVGYYNQNSVSTTIDYSIAGSASVLHASGLNLTVAGGKLDNKAASSADAEYWYAKLGYIAKIFSVGTTNFGIDYGTYDDFAQARDEAEQYSIGIVQNFDSVGSNVYLLAKNYSLDRPGTSFDDIKLIMGGVNVRF
jgi:hypothetical protein